MLGPKPLIPLLAAVVLFLGLVPDAGAEVISDDLMGGHSPRYVLFEIKFGPYKPNIDQEFGSAAPYKDIYGDDSFLLSAIQLEYEVYQGWGTIGVGGGMAFGTVGGRSLLTGGGSARDSTDLYVMPFNVSVSYHLDFLAERWSIPLVPYARAGFDYVVWWTTDGLGDVSDWAASQDSSVRPGYGGVWGWHVSGGLKLLLDILAPTMAQVFDIEVGVNNTYLFAEVLHLVADDFGQGKSLRLGDTTFLFGIAFEI